MRNVNAEWKKFGLVYNAREIRSETINVKLHLESTNTKKCFEQTF